jgi:hypothetical protein
VKLAELEELFYASVRSDAPPPELDRAFLSTPALSAVRRMNIYRSAYWARQERTLAEIFPQTRRALGDEPFRRFSRDFLTRFPSEYAAIERIGERFATFAAERRAELPRILPDLARLEWARVDVLLAPDRPTLVGRESLTGHDFARCRATLGPHVWVLRLPRAVLRYWTGEGEPDADDLESRVCTVVYRRAHKVYHGPFEDPQGTAIELAARGAVFAEVCAVLADEQSTERIASIIAGWIDRGWFERLEGG